VSQDNLNGIATMITASAGFSTAPPRAIFHPSAAHFELNVTASSLDVLVSIEFENPYFATNSSGKKESMVVKAKVAKSVTIPDSQKELQLLSTSFQDWDETRNEWTDISTKVAYTAQAEDFGFELLKVPKEKPLTATILKPSQEDCHRLVFGMPGAGHKPAQLTRIRIQTPMFSRSRTASIMILNLTLSGASGSTALSCGNLEAGVIQPQDVWTEVVIVFDGSARDKRLISFKVSDFDASSLIHDSNGDVFAARGKGLFSSTPLNLVASQVVDFVKWIKGVEPGGWTDFVAPVTAAREMFLDLLRKGRVLAGSGTLNVKIKNWVVTGFGNWVDQDCASKMAQLLGLNPALLGRFVPEFGQEGMDPYIGFIAWASDGANVDYTGAVISGVASGETLLIHAIQVGDLAKTLGIDDAARLSNPLSALQVKVNGQTFTNIHRCIEKESLKGHSLTFDWLRVTAKKDPKTVWNGTVAVKSLLLRIEDNLSFAYNTPSLSGSTEYLGRAKNTGNRNNVDKDH
ncbi:UNVERIFIED_CONTAM: hypothetical protein HDU68_002250, partial [Siphonaria sp. JEL0065]